MTEPVPGAARNRGPLLILLALFAVPLVLAFLLHYGLGWRPGGGTQHGDLLDPARPLAGVSLLRADGRETGPALFRGKWSLVYVGPADCGTTCRQALVDTRQIRSALNRDATRVQRLFLYSGELRDPARIAVEHPDLVMARIDNAPGADLLRAFPEYGGVPVTAAERVYIVDPLANLVLSYPRMADRRGLLEDIQRLLKLSHIG